MCDIIGRQVTDNLTLVLMEGRVDSIHLFKDFFNSQNYTFSGVYRYGQGDNMFVETPVSFKTLKVGLSKRIYVLISMESTKIVSTDVLCVAIKDDISLAQFLIKLNFRGN